MSWGSMAKGAREASTKSIINPLCLPLVFLVSGIVVLGCRTPTQAVVIALIALIVLAAINVVAILAAYAWYTIKDPDRLQSETHREHVMQLQMRQGPHGPEPAPIPAAITSNPASSVLPAGPAPDQGDPK